MKNHPLLSKEIFAMGCITLMAIIALIVGVNGYIYGTAMIAVAGIAGYTLARNTQPK